LLAAGELIGVVGDLQGLGRRPPQLDSIAVLPVAEEIEL